MSYIVDGSDYGYNGVVSLFHFTSPLKHSVGLVMVTTFFSSVQGAYAIYNNRQKDSDRRIIVLIEIEMPVMILIIITYDGTEKNRMTSQYNLKRSCLVLG